MLRPKRMSKVSITGAKSVMPSVIEAMYDLSLVHISDYDGSWEGFENGKPLEGSEEASEKLVTVRSLESILGIEDAVIDDLPELDQDEINAQLKKVKAEVNELDDRRNELRDQRREITERIEALKPFAELGIDLDLLHGYDSIDVVVGEGSQQAIEPVIADVDEIDAYEVFTGGDIVAIAAAGKNAEELISDALVGTQFARIEVPDEEGEPSKRLDELQNERASLENEIKQIDEELEGIREEVEEFVLAAEQYLSARVHQKDIPLQFATTKRTFIAEGWVPTRQVEELKQTLQDAVGDHVEVEEIERADYNAVEHGEHEEEDDNNKASGQAASQSTEKAVTDGGQTVTMDETPPTKMNNPGPAKPFEKLVQVVNHPKYSELDPTFIVFLTFPFAFGFMIADIAYGFLYMGIGYALWQFRSEMLNALGWVAVWCGAFTAIFGYFYDDFLGLPTGLETPGVGLLYKGYEPYAADIESGVFGLGAVEWAQLWILVAIVFGVIHMSVGWTMNFINEREHSLSHAVFGSFTWIAAAVGLYMFLFSEVAAGLEAIPAFIAGEEAVWSFVPVLEGSLPEVAGWIGIGLFVIGVIGIGYGEGIIGVIEIPSQILGQTLSYLRIPAVLLAKGGMALVVLILTEQILGVENILTAEPGDTPSSVLGEPGELAGMFTGLGLEGLLLIPLAILIFVIGHILVLVLGITAAGIQMLRLEYVEFFQKFYEGGGEKYKPFGRNNSNITED